MAYSAIVKPQDYFNTKLYTGNASSSRDITGVGFQPDFTWIKDRDGTFSHILGNAVSGDNKFLSSNGTAAESTDSTKFRTFVSDGFQVGNHNGVNANSNDYASWNWLAGASQTLNSGNVTSTVRANTTAGFSIVKWTGTADNILVSHGLGVIPKVVMIKNLSNGSAQWVVYHVGTGNTKACYLNTTATPTTASGFFNNFTPDATNFIVGSDTAVNGSGNSMIAYCFADVQGYSKFSSYTGNGSADGSFIYTGFKPAFVMMKCTDLARSWQMHNNKSDPFNSVTRRLFANLSDAEVSNTDLDFLSNGFKVRTTDLNMNGSGNNYIYMAFAENPLVANSGTDGVPATAR